MKKISIILPAYNVAPWLKDCVLSLEDQDLKQEDYEIIIVNDGSTDDTEAIAKALKETYPNIHLYTQANQGVSAARNKGIAQAIGEYILFIDPDDTVVPNCLGKMYSFVKGNTLDIGMFGMRVIHLDKTETLFADKGFENKGIDSGVAMYPFRLRDSACKYLFQKDHIKKNKIYFNENAVFVEDGEFVLKIMTVSKCVSYKHIIFYNYFVRKDSVVNSTTALSEKAIVGSLSSAKSIEQFQMDNDLTQKQHDFLNQGIVKFTVMPLFISSRLRFISNLPRIIRLIKENAIAKLPLHGLEGMRLRHAQLYNRSIYRLTGYFLVQNVSTMIKLKLRSVLK